MATNTNNRETSNTKNPRLPKNLTTKTAVEKKVEDSKSKVGKIEESVAPVKLEDIKPGKFLTYKEYREAIKEKSADNMPEIRHFDRIMDEVLLEDNNVTKYFNDNLNCTEIREFIPSNKFVTISNMVNYIQRKLDETAWYIGLNYIDCIVLTKSGKLELYSINPNPDTSRPSFGTKPTNVNFDAVRFIPYINDEELMGVDQLSYRMGYNIKSKNIKNAGVDLHKLFTNEVNNKNLMGYGSIIDMTPLVYWTKNYAMRLFPINVINKAIEGKPYPLIFSSECFIEKIKR